MKDFEPRVLSEREIKRIRKRMPLTSKQKREIRREKVKDICYYLTGVFFFIMTIIAIYMLYLMINYRW